MLKHQKTKKKIKNDDIEKTRLKRTGLKRIEDCLRHRKNKDENTKNYIFCLFFPGSIINRASAGRKFE
jgi:hypothetical protein